MAEAKDGIKGSELTDNPSLDTERESILFDQGSNEGFRYSHSPNFPKKKVDEFTDQTTPTEPDAGKTKFYAKSDGMYYRKNGAAETKLLDFAGETLSQFHTNLSPTTREDTEDWEFDSVYKSERIGFGYKEGFISAQLKHLWNVHQAHVAAVSHEIDYTGAGWSNVINANYLFKTAKTTTTPGDYLQFDFTGTSITFVLTHGAGVGTSKFQLSEDGGATWLDETTYSSKSSTTTHSVHFTPWENLERKDYTVRCTVETVGVVVEGAAYTRHANPFPITRYYDNTDGKTIDDIPFGAWLLTGSYVSINTGSPLVWNYRYCNTSDTTGSTTAEIYFYGNKLWLKSFYAYNYDININIEIDTGGGYTTAYNKANSFNTVSGDITNNPQLCGDIRLDNGTIPDGQKNKLRITLSGGTNLALLSGLFVASDLADSTHCFGLDVGQQEVISIDDPRWTVSGNWTKQANSGGMYQRQAFTTTLADYAVCDISGLSNIQSISLIHDQFTNRSKATCDLGAGTLTRYLSDYGSAQFGSQIVPIYDRAVDGDLDQATFRYALHTAGLTDIQGIKVSYFDETATGGTGATGLNSINIMPKMSRYNNSNDADGLKSVVSNTYRLEVEGEKTDDSQPRENWIDTSWLLASSAATYFNHAHPSDKFIIEEYRSGDPQIGAGSYSFKNNPLAVTHWQQKSRQLPGVGRTFFSSSDVSYEWTKIRYKPDYVL